MSELSPKTPKPPFRWGRVVLFLSLALNLGVLGVVGGTALGRFGNHANKDFAARDIGFGLFSEALAESDRKALRQSYSAARPDLRADRVQMREDLQAMLTALRADPFDAEALRALLNKGTARIQERQALGQRLLLEQIGQMSTKDRMGLAARLEKTLTRREKRDRRPKKDD